MNRNDLVERVKRLHSDMRELTLRFAKVPEKRYDKAASRVEFYNDYELEELYTWLSRVHAGPYEKVRKIFNMPPNPKKTWDMYAVHDISGMQEQVLMEHAAGFLSVVWRSPYKPKRVIRGAKKQPAEPEECDAGADGVGVRPEGVGADEGGG